MVSWLLWLEAFVHTRAMKTRLGGRSSKEESLYSPIPWLLPERAKLEVDWTKVVRTV